MSSPPDEALVAGLAAGEADEIAIFVRRFQARVYGLAYTIVGDRTTAEEVAQETFVRAWRHAAAYDPRRGRVDTWLLAIARNLAIDMRRMARTVPVEPTALEAMLASARDAGTDGREELGWLLEAVGTLPEEQQRALLMASLWGLTAKEIAAIESVPLGTAKTRIRSALLKLRSRREVSGDV